MARVIPPEFRELTSEESSANWDRHFNSVAGCAKGICPDDHTKVRGEACIQCVKTVRHVVETWALLMKNRATEALGRQEANQRLVMIQLNHGYELATAVLDPELAIALDGYGPL